MKKILLLITLFLFLNIPVKADYSPSLEEINQINRIKERLRDISHIKWKEWFQQKVYKIDRNMLIYRKNPKIHYAVLQIKQEMINIYVALWWIIEPPKYVDESTFSREIFFNNYSKNITTDLKVSEKCIKYFDYLDEIAKKNDFPVELIIAMWSKESNCNLANPWNSRWPFQITSQYYEPWNISLEEFWVAVQKFIDFSKHKWNFFNTNTYVNYKDRFWSENLNIWYDRYTLRELQIHSILYNWVSKSTTLEWNSFANANLNSEVKSSSDWVVTRFLKILKWRIDNWK